MNCGASVVVCMEIQNKIGMRLKHNCGQNTYNIK